MTEPNNNGGNAGGDQQQPAEPQQARSFTQDDVNRLLADDRRKVEAKYADYNDLKTAAETAAAANATEAERQAKEARKTARAEADAEYRPKMAETAFRVAIGNRIPANEVDDFIGDLNLARFVTDDGQVDTAKVLARVEKFAPSTAAAPPSTTPRGPVIPGHVPSGPTPAKPGSQGQAMAEKRFGAKS